jgi:glycosyltransferase involved in cell wall biosynthesis
LGAREHYAIPRALHRAGRLAELITEAWAPPRSVWGLVPHKNLRERHHPDLSHAPVRSWTARAMGFELLSRLRSLRGWRQIVRRNAWFQRKVVSALSAHQPSTLNPQPVLFSYSYTALRPFEFAKARGWRTVLGQIDPGPVEERIVAELHRAHPGRAGHWEPAPPEYWRDWRRECEQADRIIVNSRWSRQALVQEGVADGKITVIPLAYEPPPGSAQFRREYPAAFTPERPLRVLFLGQANLRKGIGLVLEIMRECRDDPVEFWMVGPVQVSVPEPLRRSRSVRWFGAVPRGEVAGFYQRADLFLFPTFSDGFGLTQLEARAWRLPILTSQHCGEVVIDGVDGLVLKDLTAARLAAAVRDCARHPERLRAFAEAGGLASRFSLEQVGTALLALE